MTAVRHALPMGVTGVHPVRPKAGTIGVRRTRVGEGTIADPQVHRGTGTTGARRTRVVEEMTGGLQVRHGERTTVVHPSRTGAGTTAVPRVHREEKTTAVRRIRGSGTTGAAIPRLAVPRGLRARLTIAGFRRGRSGSTPRRSSRGGPP